MHQPVLVAIHVPTRPQDLGPWLAAGAIHLAIAAMRRRVAVALWAGPGVLIAARARRC